MKRIGIHLPPDELTALRDAAARSGKRVSALIREAIRRQLPSSRAQGPIALWDGEIRRTSIDHDEA